MAREEVDGLTKQLAELEDRAKIMLLPRDPLDDKNIMLEVHIFQAYDADSMRSDRVMTCM